MSNDISTATPARLPAPAEPARAAPAQPHEVAQPAVQAPVKTNIQYDPVKMRQQLEESLKRLNEQLQQGSRNLNFSMDNSTKQLVIVVKNSETGEVVRQIPGDAALRVAHNIDSLKGLMFNSQT